MLNKVPVIVKYSLAAMILSIVITTFSKFPSENDGMATIPTTLGALNPGTATVSAASDGFIHPTTATETVTTTMSPVTRIATIPGPMMTTTKFIMERITETSLVTTTISVEISRSTPTCTDRTFFEMSTHTMTATVEREAATCTPSVCPHDTCNCNSYQRALGFVCDACGIAAMCLLVWSFYSNGRNSIPDVLDIVAEGDVDTLTGSNSARLGSGEESKYDDIVDNADSLVGTIESESSFGGEESDENSALDDTEDRWVVYDTNLDAEEFAKGVNVVERDVGGGSFRDDDEAMEGAKDTQEELIMESDSEEDEGPQEDPAMQMDVSGDKAVDDSQESTIKVDSTERVVVDEEPEIARSAGRARGTGGRRRR